MFLILEENSSNVSIFSNLNKLPLNSYFSSANAFLCIGTLNISHSQSRGITHHHIFILKTHFFLSISTISHINQFELIPGQFRFFHLNCKIVHILKSVFVSHSSFDHSFLKSLKISSFSSFSFSSNLSSFFVYVWELASLLNLYQV
jgi:hypothetical protein